MWYTTKDGKHINTDWFDKDRQVEMNAQEARKLNAKDQSSNIHEFGYWDYEDDGWQGEEVQRQLAWFKKNSNLEEWEKSLSDDEKMRYPYILLMVIMKLILGFVLVRQVMLRDAKQTLYDRLSISLN